MSPAFCLDDIAQAANGKCKRSILEWLLHLSAPELTKVASRPR